MAAERAGPSQHAMMGHGGASGMSMDAMVRDMRNRFLVAAVFSIPILLWSPIGREVLGFRVAAPFGLRDDVWLLLSLPVSKSPGSTVIGATINKNGTLRVRATNVGSDTALAQIVKLVQEAQNSKAPGQRLADRAAFWLVLVALVGGAVTLAAWLVARRTFAEAMLFAITVVVITCPDALGLATPTAIMVGSGLGAKRGILFKNAMALETSARIETVVMDKTGTLTKGEPEVTDLITDPMPEEQVLRLVAAVKRESEHPLAEAVVTYAEASGAALAKAEGFENVPGHGAIGHVDGHVVAVGNTRLTEHEGADLGPLAARGDKLAATGRTVVWAAMDGRAVALLGIADAPRPTSAAALAALKEAGVEVVMLTGDDEATAQRIAGQLGVDTVIAEVLPGEKAGRPPEDSLATLVIASPPSSRRSRSSCSRWVPHRHQANPAADLR
jgi:P-type Cu2+ transporter